MEPTAPALVCVRTKETVTQWRGSVTVPWAGWWVNTVHHSIKYFSTPHSNISCQLTYSTHLCFVFISCHFDCTNTNINCKHSSTQHLCEECSTNHVVQGAVCANPCPPGTYHVDCQKKCDCYNGAECDHVSGRCHCPPGFRGDKVSTVLIDFSCQLYFQQPNLTKFKNQYISVSGAVSLW